VATKIYTVHEKGGLEGEVEFVREGFSVWAFLFTFLWLWLHRAWLAGALVLGAFLLLGLGQGALGVPAYLNVAIQFAISAGVGIFGNDFYRGALARRGFIEMGVAAGESAEEAEMRWFGKRVNALEAAGMDHTGPLHTTAPGIPA
jgi:hypothetical protein